MEDYSSIMKKYVIFCFADGEGGGQNYVNSKVLWLKKNGYQPIVFFPGHRLMESNPYIPWKNLVEFKNFRCTALYYRPIYLNTFYVQKTLNWMKRIINPDGDSIIVESPIDVFSEWGELLAEKIQARHLCFLLDELLEKSLDKDFFYYKYHCHELACIAPSSVTRLFSGYKDVPNDKNIVLVAANYGSVSDVSSDISDKIEKHDWNISYIGREKSYCKAIIDNIARFARKHKEKKIGFYILGDIGDVSKLDLIDNVSTVHLGFYHPIPRDFFQYIDVVIAGAGCAILSAQEMVPTIVAEPSSCKSAGVLGYTVFDSLFSDKNLVEFDQELENVLVNNITKEMPYLLNNNCDVDKCYQEHIDFINEGKNIYFDFRRNPKEKHLVLKRLVFPVLILRDCLSFLFRKIKL